MLEVKLKEIIEKNVIKENGAIQYWINDRDAKIITVHLRDNLVRVYYVNDGADSWVTDNIEAFTKMMINDMNYVECNEKGEKLGAINSGRAVDIHEVVEIKGIRYWKTELGELYMTMWNNLHGIEPTIIPVNVDMSRPVVFRRPEDLLAEMKRLNLYKVSNMRLEEF